MIKLLYNKIKMKYNQSIAPKVYICDRCRRDDFKNGHALGGHKKYCRKPEYDKTRRRREKIEATFLSEVKLQYVAPKLRIISIKHESYSFDSFDPKTFNKKKCVKDIQELCLCLNCIKEL